MYSWRPGESRAIKRSLDGTLTRWVGCHGSRHTSQLRRRKWTRRFSQRMMPASGRCSARRGFLDRFYLRFTASSPSVRAKFAETDFVRQKVALRASLRHMTLAVADGEDGLNRYLRDLAERHSQSQLDIGAGMYDYWLDALLATFGSTIPSSRRRSKTPGRA